MESGALHRHPRQTLWRLGRAGHAGSGRRPRATWAWARLSLISFSGQGDAVSLGGHCHRGASEGPSSSTVGELGADRADVGDHERG